MYAIVIKVHEETGVGESAMHNNARCVNNGLPVVENESVVC